MNIVNSNNDIWIIGYGDIGRRLGKLYQKEGIQACVTVRSKQSLQAAKKEGKKGYQLDLDMKNVLSFPTDINNAKLFYFVPPQREGRKDTRIDRFLRQVSAQKNKLKHIVLISTTGVYGNCNGDWVNETRMITPHVDRAQRRADAEQQLIDWANQNKCQYVILRVPGIYAKDRLPITRLEKGLAVVRESESPWTNRIHADDLAMICYQAMEQMRQGKISGEILNVSDGTPSTMTSYFNSVADYAGLSRPPQISLKQAEKELSEGMMSYMKESRRISNKKMLEKLSIQLIYPSLMHCLKKST
ncbi:MAG: NAD-dependent epimerase/dehydratase family protein [Thiotrichaceae bacterium]